MDEFLKLNWSKKFPKQLRYRKDVYSSCGFSEDEEDVFVCHLNEINPEFYGRTHNNSDPQKTPDTPAKSQNANPPQEMELHLFKKFPNRSKMPGNIHTSCLQYLRKLEEIQEEDLSSEDRKIYLSCEATRKQEKQEFSEFTKNYFLTHLSHRILKIHKGMEDILIERWKKGVMNVKQRKHQNYQLQTALVLDYRLPEDEKVALEHEREFYRTGNIPKISCDFSSGEKITLAQDCEQLKIYLEGDCGAEDEDAIKEIAASNGMDFILPLEAIERMINGKNVAWNIPFRIEEIGKRTLVTVESPLPLLKMNSKDRNAEIFRHCLEMKILQHENDHPETEDVLDAKELDSESEDEEHLVIDEMPDESQTQETKKITVVEESLGLVKKARTRSQNNSFCGCILSCGDTKCKLLVKTHQDGAVLTDHGTDGINISTKIEYQTEFGAEEMTLEELIHEWCMQIFNPLSKTLRIRIDSQIMQILSVKEVPLKRIERDLERLHGISSQDLLQRFWGLVSMMKNFPIHDYLMHHDPIHDRKLMIYVSREAEMPDKNFLQLSRLYGEIDFKRKPLLEQHEWIPIDDQEVTLLHERENVMPCAFPHWGKSSGYGGIWNEKKNLKEKYEARIKTKKEIQDARERLKKRQKNLKKKEKRKQKQMVKQLQKDAEKTEKFGKMLAKSGDTTVPDWFFDEDGRVRIQNSDDPESQEVQEAVSPK